MIKKTLRYYFNISYKDPSGKKMEFVTVEEVLDEAGADRDAYRKALIELANFIILNRDFVAPETLKIKMHKEVKVYDIQGD